MKSLVKVLSKNWTHYFGPKIGDLLILLIFRKILSPIGSYQKFLSNAFWKAWTTMWTYAKIRNVLFFVSLVSHVKSLLISEPTARGNKTPGRHYLSSKHFIKRCWGPKTGLDQTAKSKLSTLDVLFITNWNNNWCMHRLSVIQGHFAT